MKEISIKGDIRTEVGKKAARLMRKEGIVPCVIYGVERDEKGLPKSKSIAIAEKELNKIVYTPDIYVVNLTIGDETCKAVLKDIQFHPVKDNIIHADFYQLTPEKPIVMAVPVRFEGHAVGVRAGGNLNKQVRKLKVQATYDKIPERLVVDVTNLNIGKSIKVGDLSYEGLELVTPKEVVVCSVKSTRAVTADTTAAAAAPAAATGDAAAAEAPAEEHK